MAMDAKERKILMLRLGAALVILLTLGIGAWFVFGSSDDAAPAQEQLSPSDPMMPPSSEMGKMAVTAPVQAGTLIANPTAIQFKQNTPGTEIFTLTAQGGPVAIQGAMIPTNDADVLKVTNIDCPVIRGPVPAPQEQLQANQSCSASVTWAGGRSVNSTLMINIVDPNASPSAPATTSPVVPTATPTATPSPAVAGAPAGQTTPASQSQGLAIPITAVSTEPNAPNGQVPPPAENGQASAARPAAGPSQTQLAREAYLAARRGQGFGAAMAPQGLQASARSPYTSWDNIGIQYNKSSFPTDMSRVITPDKPLTAVLTYQIDTRQTVTAVATVDRDVYGSSGRTVVIPRGTKIIGRVGGSATDRVGIAWNQLIRPDGVRFVFTGESGDAMGRGGVPGRINERYLERYGYSLLPNIVGAGITAGLGGQSSTTAGTTGTVQSQDARAVAAQILQQPLQQIADDIYHKKSSIPIQITIPAGTRITVWSTGDLRLKPVGEDDAPRAQGGAQSQAQQQGFGYNQGGRSGQGFNPYATQGQAQAPMAAPAQTSSSSPADDSRGDPSSLQVGRVDANGNYIPPGTTAPPPGPVVTNTNNAAQRTQPAAKTSFPANPNPWE